MKKILFYGNCHLGTLGSWFHENYNDKFQVIDCSEGGLIGFYGTKCFCVWSPENKGNQIKFYKSIHEKIKEADIFVFQSHRGSNIIDELKTAYLYNNIATGIKICIPNNRFLAYPICNRSYDRYIRYIHDYITKDSKKILEYITHEDDPKFLEILYSNYPFVSTDTERSHNITNYIKDSKEYSLCIDMNNYIENNWKSKILFSSIAHPTYFYYRELINQIFKIINEPIDEEKIKNINYPGNDGMINPLQFKFFRDLFPNIKFPKNQIIKKFEISHINEFLYQQ